MFILDVSQYKNAINHNFPCNGTKTLRVGKFNHCSLLNIFS